jgi:hypothetical protein
MTAQAEKVTKPRDKKKGIGEKKGSSFIATQLQAQSMTYILDGGNRYGIWTRSIIRPILEAGTRAAVRNSEIGIELNKIMNEFYSTKELLQFTVGALPAMKPKLTYIQEIDEFLSKEQMVMLLLNWGTEKNREHLRANGLSSTSATKLTDEQVHAVFALMDEKDFEFAKKIWELVSSLRPAMKEVEVRYKGFASEDVTPTPFTVKLKNGKSIDLPGGYISAVFDSDSVKRTKKENILRDKYGNSATAAVRQGFTISPVGPDKKDGKPLNLKFSAITRYLHDAVHYTEVIDAVSSVEKILNVSSVAQSVQDKFGVRGREQLELWLKDFAVGTMGAADVYSQIFSFVRTNLISSTMGLSLPTILSQSSGAVMSVKELGGGVRGVRYLMKGYQKVFRPLLSGNLKAYNDYAEEIYARSSFMKMRYDTQNREIRESTEIFQPLPLQWRNNIVKTTMYPILFMQKNSVDLAVWTAAELEYMDRNPNATADEAAQHASDVVRVSQSSSEMAAMSGLMRGTVSQSTRQNQFVKAFTLAFSYQNNKFNRVYEQAKLLDWSNSNTDEKIKSLQTIFILLYADAFITDMILHRLPDMWPDDGSDDDWMDVLAGWGWWFAVRPFELFVLAREAVAAASGYDVDTPWSKAVQDVFATVEQVGQLEADKALLKSTMKSAGALAAIPSSQPNRVIELIDALQDGEVETFMDGYDILVGSNHKKK